MSYSCVILADQRSLALANITSMQLTRKDFTGSCKYVGLADRRSLQMSSAQYFGELSASQNSTNSI